MATVEEIRAKVEEVKRIDGLSAAGLAWHEENPAPPVATFCASCGRSGELALSWSDWERELGILGGLRPGESLELRSCERCDRGDED